MNIVNPYVNVNFATAIRKKAISHEHISGGPNGAGHGEIKLYLQRCCGLATADGAEAGRGIDIVCGVNYMPAVPSYPLTGTSSETLHTWRDVVSATNTNLTDKYVTIDFAYNEGDAFNIYKNGILVKSVKLSYDLSSLISLPNAEHAYAAFDENKSIMCPSIHINIIGNMWGEPSARKPDGFDERTMGSMSDWRPNHILYTWRDIFNNSRENALFTDSNSNPKLFGTINHLGWTFANDANLTYERIKEVIDLSDGIIKATEIWTNGGDGTLNQLNANKYYYDRLLCDGYRLNCVAVVDWQIVDKPLNEQRESHSYLIFNDTVYTERGCNVLLLPTNYESLTKSKKEELALDSYIAGEYYASGLGELGITNVVVGNDYVEITFSETCDYIETVIDGETTITHNQNKARAYFSNNTKYARFYARTSHDFVYSNPFFNNDYGKPPSSLDKEFIKKIALFD